VAEQLSVTKQTVSKWRGRFVRHQLDGLLDAPRSGAPRTIDDERVEAVVAKTLESVPKGIVPRASSSRRSAPTSASTTPHRSRSPGRRPPMTSSPALSALVCEFINQHTRGAPPSAGCHGQPPEKGRWPERARHPAKGHSRE
jgi:hypothetical protein